MTQVATQWLTVPEVAAIWRCCERSVLDLIRSGDLKATKIAGKWLIRPADAEAHERQNMDSVPTPRPIHRRRRKT